MYHNIARFVTAAASISYIVFALRPAIARTMSNHMKMAVAAFSIFQFGKMYVSMAVGLPGCSGIPLIDVYTIIESVVMFTITFAELIRYALFTEHVIGAWTTAWIATTLCATEIWYISFMFLTLHGEAA